MLRKRIFKLNFSQPISALLSLSQPEFFQKPGSLRRQPLRFDPEKHFLLTGGGHEERQHHGYQRCALYESSGKNHVSADVAHCFGLAGNSFYGFTTNRTYTDTGADGGQTCSNCCVHNF